MDRFDQQNFRQVGNYLKFVDNYSLMWRQTGEVVYISTIMQMTGKWGNQLIFRQVRDYLKLIGNWEHMGHLLGKVTDFCNKQD